MSEPNLLLAAKVGASIGAIIGIAMCLTFGVFRLHERMGWCEAFYCSRLIAQEPRHD